MMLSEENNYLTQNVIQINTAPISGGIKSLRPVTLELVSKSKLETLWDHLVNQYHYLEEFSKNNLNISIAHKRKDLPFKCLRRI